MGWAKNGLAFGLLLAGLSMGCQNKMYEQNKELMDENRALRDQNEAMRRQQAQAQPPPTVQQPIVAQQPAAPPPAQNPAPPPPSNPKPVEQIGGLETTVSRSGNTIVHLPSEMFFDPGQATLKQSSKSTLDSVVTALKGKFRGNNLIVEGHTDSNPIRVSKWKSNQELSEARADTVKQYLVAHGISDSRITIKGYGDTRPRSSDLAKNRRVEIVVLTGR